MIRRTLLALGLAACTEATPPERAAAYEFAIDCGIPDLCTSEADSGLVLIFRWPKEAMPVRVWVEPTGDLPAIVGDALDRWQAALLYGEFRATLVSRAASADIIIQQGAPATIDPVDGVELPSCGGGTPVTVASADTSIALPFDIRVRGRLGATQFDVTECLYRVVLHELGHAFGLFLHSGDPNDVMYRAPAANALSPGDVATFARLYHTSPTVRLPAGR